MLDTLSFSPSEQGWVSRYSYQPDFMLGLDSTMYSFKNGNIYIHNSTNVDRGEFYGVKYPASVTTTFNESPFDVKMFKTLSLDSDDSWDASYITDLNSGSILSSSFELKEGNYFAYIRRDDSLSIAQDDAKSLSTQGVGAVNTYSSLVINFSFSISSPVSVGDRIYIASGLSFTYVGVVQSYTATSITLVSVAVTPAPGDFIVVAKNKNAESFGMRGYYMDVTLENNNVDAVELFAISSSIFKSFP